MSIKKDRSRFTIKFNENAPAHETVIRLLEKQAPRSKANFIANAILHYIHCPEISDIPINNVEYIDTKTVEDIVLRTLEQKNRMQQINTEKNFKQPNNEIKSEKISKQSLPVVDTKIVGLIKNTMIEFRNN